MTPGFRYDRPTILLHWASALLIAALWGCAQIIDMFGNSAEGPIRSVHILLGLALIPVLLGRIGLRVFGRSRPPQEPGLLAGTARLLHIALYVLIAGTIVLGIANAWMRGNDIFGILHFAAAPYPDRVTRRSISGWHELAANSLVILALLHAAAALAHHYVLRDGVLRRMLPQD